MSDTRFVNESFEGIGAEESWTINVSSGNTLNADSLGPGIFPLNGGSQCLETIVQNEVNNSSYGTRTRINSNINYVRGYIYIEYEGLENLQSFLSLSLLTSYDGVSAGLRIAQSSGTLVVQMRYQSSGSSQFSTPAYVLKTGVWYRFEYKYDITNMEWEFRIYNNEGSLVHNSSGSLSAAISIPKKITSGIALHTGTGATKIFTDLVAWDNSGWIGVEPKISRGRTWNDAGKLDFQRIRKAQHIIEIKPPTVEDKNYPIPFFWFDKVEKKLYVLINVTNGVATWKTLI